MTQIKRLFIANRGEIARRIAQTARKLGIETVCIAQRDRVPVFLKPLIDQFHLVDEENSALYLNAETMIRIAKENNCDGIHPGFGFLSENASFAAAVSAAGLAWIGPKSDAIEAMASKSAARELAQKAGVPCVPGIQGIDISQSEAPLVQFVESAGLPVLIKAALGGGGKGMRVVRSQDELIPAMQRASSEALNSFGDGSLIVEKFLENPRHVEVQILGDHHGNVVSVGDRDCSVQRRHQKVIEEAPAPFLHPETRRKMHEAAIRLAKEVGYSSAGTVEFLVEGSDAESEQGFYFLEMNTRLQVEHPVSEEVFQTDLVAWQLKVAMGETVVGQIPANSRGHSIEVRIYAEDPSNDFFPAPGPVYGFEPFQHAHVRWEIGLDPIDEVSPNFDPMVAKLVTTGETRLDAIRYMKMALDKTVFCGPIHNMEFISEIMADEIFLKTVMGTRYIEERREDLLGLMARKRASKQDLADRVLIQLAKSPLESQEICQVTRNAFQTHSGEQVKLSPSLHFTCSSFPPKSVEIGTGEGILASQTVRFQYAKTLAPEGQFVFCKIDGQGFQRQIPREDSPVGKSAEQENAIVAPVPGKVIKVLTSNDAEVKAKQTVVILESMKMEFEVQANKDARIKEVVVKEGQQVNADELLINLA
ncbi:acetyl/propionyl/methylcrotonyl-CoA carboxylase subunit alpha [Pseudobacteriovorax antillogorgiicola]|uniref:Geranyl-CoA carboxylase alpha subunit n=1 Tax=Pseudobacteriovorax antillogorgiicola TaxID=1513793 RepID=A0A1Y6B8Z0_9BACT|nr:biotin carboxylase N-terminal domain-containing protein [Pseudobacteriovorax antillogorgiicola]TCS58583.1 geranyl-CoA carboxylase alpha subunit [Pseudobacteriovorax antillogorgiicola]SME97226.1 geranyl-CoA carboxylase alpha subunit [Pseudobacteriovorax antillogorgiicola]